MTSAARRLQLRIERSCERFGASYPWWIPTYSTLVAIGVAIAAWVQRGGVAASAAALAGLVLACLPLLVWLPRGWMMPTWVEAGITVVAMILFLTQPVGHDLAPLMLLMKTGEVAAVCRAWVAVVAATVNIAVLIVAGSVGRLDNVPLYVIGIVLAGDVGIALRWQMRALRAERENAGIAQERAILTERQRLAREVHDVVGHSLSINLLHVTAARHALQQHGDVADAIESLTEAERVGRSAMGDLRRTVAVLAGPGDTQPLPGVDDIAGLVDRSRAAGLDVSYVGEPCSVDAAAGLGIFRIVQESLGNVARHAPTSQARVELVERDGATRLTVRNTLPDGARDASSGGSGLPGMAARAEQMGAGLRAGVDGNDWVVALTVTSATARTRVET